MTRLNTQLGIASNTVSPILGNTNTKKPKGVPNMTGQKKAANPSTAFLQKGTGGQMQFPWLGRAMGLAPSVRAFSGQLWNQFQQDMASPAYAGQSGAPVRAPAGQQATSWPGQGMGPVQVLGALGNQMNQDLAAPAYVNSMGTPVRPPQQQAPQQQPAPMVDPQQQTPTATPSVPPQLPQQLMDAYLGATSPLNMNSGPAAYNNPDLANAVGLNPGRNYTMDQYEGQANQQLQGLNQTLQGLQGINAGNVPQGPFSPQTEALAEQGISTVPEVIRQRQQQAAHQTNQNMLAQHAAGMSTIPGMPDTPGRSGRPGWRPEYRGLQSANNPQMPGGPGSVNVNALSPDVQREQTGWTDTGIAGGLAMPTYGATPEQQSVDRGILDQLAKYRDDPQDIGRSMGLRGMRTSSPEAQQSLRQNTVFQDARNDRSAKKEGRMLLHQLGEMQKANDRYDRLKARRTPVNPVAANMMNMMQRHPQLAMQYMQMQQRGMLGQQGLNLQAQIAGNEAAQREQQHTEKMTQYNNLNPEQRMAASMKFDADYRNQYQAKHGRQPTDNQVAAARSQYFAQHGFGGFDGGPTMGTPQGQGSGAVPDWAQGIQDEDELWEIGRDNSVPDEQIQAISEQKFGRKSLGQLAYDVADPMSILSVVTSKGRQRLRRKLDVFNRRASVEREKKDADARTRAKAKIQEAARKELARRRAANEEY